MPKVGENHKTIDKTCNNVAPMACDPELFVIISSVRQWKCSKAEIRKRQGRRIEDVSIFHNMLKKIQGTQGSENRK